MFACLAKTQSVSTHADNWMEGDCMEDVYGSSSGCFVPVIVVRLVCWLFRFALLFVGCKIPLASDIVASSSLLLFFISRLHRDTAGQSITDGPFGRDQTGGLLQSAVRVVEERDERHAQCGGPSDSSLSGE